MLYSLLIEAFHPGELVFYLLGCWAAWMTGKASASTWRTVPQLLVYGLVLAAGMRFLHYALYQGPFLSPIHYLSDLVVLSGVALAGYRYTRTNQMVSQYHWMYEKASPFTWKQRA